MNAASEQLSNPPVLYSWLRHLPTWVQQPSHGLLSLQLPLPRGMIVLQSKGPDEEDPEEEELPLSSLLDDVASGCAATCTCEPGTRPPKSSGRTSQEDFIRPVEALDGARRRIGTLEHPDVDGDAERIAVESTNRIPKPISGAVVLKGYEVPHCTRDQYPRSERYRRRYTVCVVYKTVFLHTVR